MFNALERRASDIHIETRNADVAIKYRIDGRLASRDVADLQGLARDDSFAHQGDERVGHRRAAHHRRTGAFRVRYKGRQIDFRVSIMPTVFGEDAVLRILDKQSMSEKFKRLSLEVVGFGRRGQGAFRALHSRALRHGCW